MARWNLSLIRGSVSRSLPLTGLLDSVLKRFVDQGQVQAVHRPVCFVDLMEDLGVLIESQHFQPAPIPVKEVKHPANSFAECAGLAGV